jgi:3-oxoacyl-[acyl-carrier protein] reductase
MPEMLAIDLTDRRAVVTGGSRGIGRAIALHLARAGAHVGIAYHSREAEAQSVLADVQRHGVRGWIERGDLAEERAAERLLARAAREFGGLDIFVGNAGVWPPDHVNIGAMSTAQWRRTLAVNLDAIFYGTRAAARLMADGGRIVLISSTAGQRGEAGHADYAASKGALISMVKGLCIELADRQITVNCVAPGWVDTEMIVQPYQGTGRDRIDASIPLRRVAGADDIAGPVAFLCSALARHITGEVLNVNGGSVLCG